MSEHEKSSSGGASPVVVVEQSTASRHKQPYRPTELEDGTELHHKRSRAPAVPSVAEEFKTLAQDAPATESDETREHEHDIREQDTNQLSSERKESERALTSDSKYKSKIGTRTSSNIKRRDPVPENIGMATLDLETRKGTITPPPQPIPAIAIVPSAEKVIVPGQEELDKKSADEDSITEDNIAELRNAEPKHSEWELSIDKTKTNQKENPWESEEYLEKVQLRDPVKMRVINLTPNETGINIAIPKRGTQSKSGLPAKDRNNVPESRAVKVDPDIPYVKIFGALHAKYNIIRVKIKNVFHF